MTAIESEEARAPLELQLKDLRPTERPVIIVARVVAANRREITRRSDGGRRSIVSGLLSDGTATVRFTWWDPPAEAIERGMILRAGPVQLREFQGRTEVSFGWKTRVAPAGEDELPNLLAQELPAQTTRSLAAGDEGFRLEARVGEVRAKTVSVGSDRRLLYEGILFDASGSIAFTAWSDFGLREGEAIRVVGGSVRAFRGRAQLVLDERSHVDRRTTVALPELSAWRALGPVRISSLEASHGADRAVVAGTVVGLLPPSGVVLRCPSCRRAVGEGTCRVHGTVVGEPDLRARLVLDDGTGAVTVNADRALTERLWGRTLDECRADPRRTVDPASLETELFNAVFGRRFRGVGRVVSDEFGLTMYPETLDTAREESAARLIALRSRGGTRTP
jgi:replication factor A1